MDNFPGNNEKDPSKFTDSDFESFFSSFDSLESDSAAKPAETDKAPKAPEKEFDAAEGAESFIGDTKKNIEDFLSGLDLSQQPSVTDFDEEVTALHELSDGFNFKPAEENPAIQDISGLASAPASSASSRRPGAAGFTPSPAAQTAGNDFDINFVNLAADDEGAENREARIEADAAEIAAIQARAAKDREKRGAKEAKKKKVARNEIIRRCVLTLSILVIIGCGGYLVYRYFLAGMQSDRVVDDARDYIIEDTDPSATFKLKQELQAEYPDVQFKPDMLLKYYKLYAQNPDLRGWITIKGFGIDLPIVQGADNSYYLKRDVYGKWTEYGVPFFDYRNELYITDRNIVVYGHNMNYDKKKLFALLENYRTIDGFKQAPIIECNTIYEDITWKVYAVFITNSKKSDDNGYVFNYLWTENISDELFTEYVHEVNKRALYRTGVDITTTDSILTLSTCCYDFQDARLVVVARRLRDGESTDIDFSKASVNPNPRYPQAWYNANNKTNPYANDTNWLG